MVTKVISRGKYETVTILVKQVPKTFKSSPCCAMLRVAFISHHDIGITVITEGRALTIRWQLCSVSHSDVISIISQHCAMLHSCWLFNRYKQMSMNVAIFQATVSVQSTELVWWSGVVVSTLASINEVNLRQAQLVLRWATISGFNSQCWTLISVCNQPATQDQLSLPSIWGRQMSTSFGWEGKGRYGSFC